MHHLFLFHAHAPLAFHVHACVHIWTVDPCTACAYKLCAGAMSSSSSTSLATTTVSLVVLLAYTNLQTRAQNVPNLGEFNCAADHL